MPTPGYITKNQAIADIQSATGYGRRAALRKIDDMASAGEITLIPDPGNSHATLISKPDVQKVIAAMTLPPVE